MPTLYVKNVPKDLYEAIRKQAHDERTSISAVVLTILAQSVATPAEIARRRALLDRARRLRSRRSPSPGPFLSTGAMLREDRER